jgi:hypothetical protein
VRAKSPRHAAAKSAVLRLVAINLAVKITTGMAIPIPWTPASLPAAFPITMRIFGKLNLSN